MIDDIRPFWLIGALGAIGFGLLMLVVRKAYPNYLGRVLMIWGVANLCLGANYIIRLGSSWESEFVYHVFSCTLFAACLSLEYRALRELKHLPSSTGMIIGLPLVMFVVCAWFTSVQHNISIEFLIFNLLNLATMILIAWTLLHAEDGRRPFADIVTASAYALLAIATGAVILDFIRVNNYSPVYDFNSPRSVFYSVIAVLAEGLVFPLFLLMVSERQNRELVVQAMHDPLTGLYNRRAFNEIAFREISGASRTGLGISVVLFDIDDFKQVNDQYGHLVGDIVLKAAASTLRSSLRDEDFLCRWGGDEFCALLPRADHEQAQDVAERALRAFEILDLSSDKFTAKVTISIGIVTNVRRVIDFASLFEQADCALFRAKVSGRKKFVFASEKSPETSLS
jgi:diguanylate cyclase (GGDEF)-like protein